MQLNKWLGSDKPKKDDFNNDNQKIDEACRLLSQDIEQLRYEQQNGASAQALTALEGTLAVHAADSQVHVTTAEKLAWSNSAAFTLGTYVGTGTQSQKITLGFKPRFGLIFAVGDGIARVSWTASQLSTSCGMISELGCSQGLTLNSDGFTVEHHSAGTLDGFCLKFNSSGTTYVYFLWK